MMRKIYILTVVLIFIGINAQLEPQGVKSPNADSFQRYGSYNVSLSNGTVDVKIPLHEMPLQSSVLSLDLGYDTSGLKISQPSGSTGINWSINLPGIISRQVNGSIDELNPLSAPFAGGHFYEFNALDIPNIETQSGLRAFSDSVFPVYGSTPVSQDLQPDVFTFKVLGKAGKFFLGQDGVWKVQSEHNFKVIINESDFILPFNIQAPLVGNSQVTGDVIGKITLIDDNGTNYIFGSQQNSVEFTVSGFYSQKYQQIISTAWYLDSVIDRLGKSLFTCSYERGKPIARFFNNVQDQNFLYRLLSGSLISPVYLSSINTSDEKAIFHYSDRNDLTFGTEENLEYKFQLLKTNNGATPDIDPSWVSSLYHLYTNFGKNSLAQLTQQNPFVLSNWHETSKLLVWNKLDKIEIVTNNILKKEIDFEYVNKPNERLFLTRVNFKNTTNGQTAKFDYKLKYNYGNGVEYNFDGSIPKYLFLGVNHYDSYCRTNLTNQVSWIDCGETNNDHLVKKGSLLKIEYPTGGFTYFDFEQNDFSSFISRAHDSFVLETSNIRKTGGLRIKKIVNFFNLNSPDRETISYQYNINDYEGNTGGILSLDANMYPQSALPILEWYESYLLPLGNAPKLSYYGPPIIYSRVIEERENSNGKQKTVFYFSNHDTASYYMDKPFIVTAHPLDNLLYYSSFLNYIDKSFLREKLLEKKVYDVDNKLLVHNSYEYNLNDLENRYVRSFSYGTFPGILYKIYYGDAPLKKEVRREYFNNKELKTDVTYNRSDYPYRISGAPIYNGSNRLDYTLTSTPDGNTLKTEIEYQFNCIPGGSCNEDAFGLPKKVQNFKNQVLLTKDEITYKPLNSNSLSLVVDEVKKTFSNNNTPDNILKYTRYDPLGNVIEYKKENGIVVSIIMDNKRTKPLAKIEGIGYDELANYLPNIQKPYISNSSDALLNISDPNAYANLKDIELRGYVSNMRKDLTNAFVSSYTYDSFNRLKTMTTPNGFVEFYEYDSLGRLSAVRDVDGNLLKEISINYTNNSSNYPFLLEPAYNDVFSQGFIKQNCVSPLKGNIYTYTVPAKKYSSLIPGTANNLAYNDLLTNGPIQTNLYGTCITPNNYGLTGLSTIELQSSSLYLNGITVSGYFAFKPLPTFDPQNGSYIGIVPDNMIPSTERIVPFHEIGNGVERFWTFTIQTDGYVTAVFSGTALSSSSGININSFQYQK